MIFMKSHLPSSGVVLGLLALSLGSCSMLEPEPAGGSEFGSIPSSTKYYGVLTSTYTPLPINNRYLGGSRETSGYRYYPSR